MLNEWDEASWGKKVKNCINIGSGLAISSFFLPTPLPNISLLSILTILNRGIWKVSGALPTIQTHTHLSSFNSNVTFVFPPSFLSNVGKPAELLSPWPSSFGIYLSPQQNHRLLESKGFVIVICFCRNGNECATPKCMLNKWTDWWVLGKPQARASLPAQAPQVPRWCQQTWLFSADSVRFRVDVPSSSSEHGWALRECPDV